MNPAKSEGSGRWAPGSRSLSHSAYQTAGAEGSWALTEVEGQVPVDLLGRLYRVAPGQKENHGTPLHHFFDGDAFLSCFTFRQGRVHLQARFVDIPPRLEEIKAGRMLYPEFGTLPPPPPPGWNPPQRSKNQPSINVIHWDNRLLGLSEGGHPAAIDPEDFTFQGRWDFYGTLPKDVPFTAHPKFDWTTGKGYAFGVRQGPGFDLTVFRMEEDGKLTRLYSFPQKAYFMIHDMLLTREHLVFVIPPVSFDLPALFSGKVPPSGALRFSEDEPTRFLILPLEGRGDGVVIEQPASMVFHHGNAYEEDGRIIVDSILSPDRTSLDYLQAWSQDRRPRLSPPELTRLILDPARKRVESRRVFGTAEEFPRFDVRQTGKNARYLYTLESGDPEDFFVSTALVRHDLHRGKDQKINTAPERALGEAVFVPHPTRREEDRGWLVLQGYDGARNENFLEIRDAATLDLEARVWTGRHFPLGFHGNFYGLPAGR
jgi:all-trans-8'-apo-beta-carotenal 15,15'-oxygenase